MKLKQQKPTDIEHSPTVVKHNAIINASYKLTLSETRLLLACISQIDSSRDRDKDEPFIIQIKDVRDLFADENATHLYRDIRTATERIGKRQIRINDGNKSGYQNWVIDCFYYKNKGAIEIKFHPDVLNYLTDLKGSFTQYKIQYVAKFTNVHSIRIYELLAQWQGRGNREISVDELREKLQLGEQYPKIYDLKRYVIDKALADINTHSNINVACGERKLGRQTLAFQFKFKQKDGMKDKPKQLGKSNKKQLIEKHARVGESYESAEARLRKEGVL